MLRVSEVALREPSSNRALFFRLLVLLSPDSLRAFGGSSTGELFIGPSTDAGPHARLSGPAECSSLIHSPFSGRFSSWQYGPFSPAPKTGDSPAGLPPGKEHWSSNLGLEGKQASG
jgi:hypothetical protein